MANARMAVLVRRRILSGLIRRMRDDPEWAPPITADVLKLLKESEDRGLGAATRHVSVSGDARVFRLDPTQMSTRALEEVMSIIDGRGRAEEDGGTGEEPVVIEGPDGRVMEVLADDDYRGDDLDLDDPDLL